MMPNEASAKANAGRLQKAFENDLNNVVYGISSPETASLI
jgi:hypothetical protein